uniref:Uncharacterized protein n=1 Tax=Rhizophora mucronata TaxID=61149 RepID=A0A2P2R2T0_RHIMU
MHTKKDKVFFEVHGAQNPQIL